MLFISFSHIFDGVKFKSLSDFMVKQPSSVFPSVRCGLEMAILNAIAARQGSSLLNILRPNTIEQEKSERSSKVKICALLDSKGTPSEVADAATTLVEEGFTAIKLKVCETYSNHTANTTLVNICLRCCYFTLLMFLEAWIYW